MLMPQRFGITERGDAARDLSWVDKMNGVVGAVLITKNIDDLKFQSAALKCASKAIVHATITTMGHTHLEPNVEPWQKTVVSLLEFAELFPRNQLVLRIDPIVPCHDTMNALSDILSACRGKIKRVRFSFIDNYPHIKARGVQLHWSSFHPPVELQDWFLTYFKSWLGQFDFESCGEGNPNIPSKWKVGCISRRDYEALGLTVPALLTTSRQRKECMCMASKTELLTKRRQCPNGCLYCYWK